MIIWREFNLSDWEILNLILANDSLLNFCKIYTGYSFGTHAYGEQLEHGHTHYTKTLTPQWITSNTTYSS